jgi:hypothetical protein
MEDKNYDLEDKINLIYNYLYNINSKNCFSFNKLTLGKIGLDDIKITLPSTNQKEKEYYHKNKSNILNGKFKLISFNEKSYELLFKRYSNQFPVNVKVSFYTDYKSINLMENTNNNDSVFSYILSQLVLSKKTKHILLPVINLDINYSDIESFIINDSSHSIIKTGILNNNITNKCCLQLREHFFRTVNLEQYLLEHTCSYKGLLFQVIHTLATIQKEFEGFRHNNLTLSNILVYLKKSSDTLTEYEGFNNDKFYLPNDGFDIKITNFEYAIIPKFYGMFNIKNPNIKFADKPNSYYDLYTFLNDLLEGSANISSRFRKIDCDVETKKFLDKIIPLHIRGIAQHNFNKNLIIVNPIELLYDNYFNEYMNKPSITLVEDSMTNHLYLTGRKTTNKLNTWMNSDNYSSLGNQDKIISNYNIMNINSQRIIKYDETDNYIKLTRTCSKSKKVGLYGGGIEAPPYKSEANTPFITNDQRNTFKKRSAENPVREPPIILEQKIYDTSQKPSAKPQFPPNFIPLYDPDGQHTNNLLPNSNNVLNQPPVQKVYNISLSNPVQGFSTINRIYEDMLPGNQSAFTYLTIFERKQLIDFLRNNILDYGDGEEMTITGGKNSMLEYIKLLDVNPYTSNTNPYLDLAKNFLIYRAGYPVRYSDKTKLINIGKQSTGLNVRMYGMSIGDLKCKTISNLIDSDKFDLWREMKYYDLVKNNIVKNKISPNFISPVLYKIDSQSKIDWSKLDMLRNKGVSDDYVKELYENQQKINEFHELDKDMGLFQGLIPHKIKRQLDMKLDKKVNVKLNPEDKEDLTLYSNKVLVLLTEAPTSSFIQWCTATYESLGSIKKMISTGYHTPDVWKSILFQLVYACAVLQEKEILIEQFSLENNVFIKDIFSDAKAIGSWIYKVDEVEYYIPNHGYVLVIDSKYTDIETQTRLITSNPIIKSIKYKIYSTIFKDNSSYDITTLQDKILIQFKNIIDPDNFAHNFKVKGGSSPDDSILELLKKMKRASTSITKIREFIPQFFGEFVHNRIGTLLSKNEKDNINILSRPNFDRGNLMIWQKRFQEYEWVIFLGNGTNEYKKKILIKDGYNYTHQEVFTSALFSYPSNEILLPDSSNKMKFDEAHIYETYNLDN